jgi:3'(2'), 5'-bisphosphate nucleotidase
VDGATLDVGERLAFARAVALAAGVEVSRRYGDDRFRLKGGQSPVTEADLASNRVIVTAIRARYPGEAILSEESKDSEDRMTADTLWVVDPLDGTKEFLAGNGEFAVMIGLVARGQPIVGVVHAPARGVLYAAATGHGAWLEHPYGRRERLQCAPRRPDGLRLVSSRSHAEPLLLRMQEALGITDVQPSGSVGIKCGLIAEGRRDVYIHPAPHLKEWDTCAPEVVLTEAGGRVTDCRGDRLRYNKPSPNQPHGIVACSEAVADEVLGRVIPLYESTVDSQQSTTVKS